MTRAEGSHTLTIKEFLPHTTNLFREAHGIIELPEKIDFADFTWENIKYEDSKAHHDHFYLHESKLREKAVFELTLHDGEKERTGSFSAELYRNHYFPLVIHLTDYSLDISGTYELAPVAVNPFTVNITPNGYTVNLPEGCSNVAMSIKLKDNSSQNEPTGVTWTYTKDGALEEDFDISTDNTEGSLSITSDKLTALPTGSISLHLTAHYDNKDIEFNVVTINVRALDDEEWNTTRSATPEAQPIIIEL